MLGFPPTNPRKAVHDCKPDVSVFLVEGARYWLTSCLPRLLDTARRPLSLIPPCGKRHRAGTRGGYRSSPPTPTVKCHTQFRYRIQWHVTRQITIHCPTLNMRNKRMSAPDRGSFPSRPFVIQSTAGVLPLRVKTVSRTYLGCMLDCVTNIRAVMTMPNSSSTLMDVSPQPRTVSRSRAHTSSSKSKRHHAPGFGLEPQDITTHGVAGSVRSITR